MNRDTTKHHGGGIERFSVTGSGSVWYRGMSVSYNNGNRCQCKGQFVIIVQLTAPKWLSYLEFAQVWTINNCTNGKRLSIFPRIRLRLWK